MKQSDLNRAVARRTGESVRCIRQRGFTILYGPPFAVCPELASDAPCAHDGGDGPIAQADAPLATSE